MAHSRFSTPDPSSPENRSAPSPAPSHTPPVARKGLSPRTLSEGTDILSSSGVETEEEGAGPEEGGETTVSAPDHRPSKRARLAERLSDTLCACGPGTLGFALFGDRITTALQVAADVVTERRAQREDRMGTKGKSVCAPT